MKKEYDDLSPAEKARFTRMLNKLGEQRHAASAIQYEVYREKSDANYLLVAPQVEAVREEYDNKIAELRQQIDALSKERSEKIGKLHAAHREVAAPEFAEYEKASNQAHKWFLAASDKAIAEFYAEVNA